MQLKMDLLTRSALTYCMRQLPTHVRTSTSRQSQKGSLRNLGYFVYYLLYVSVFQGWLNGLVVSALGIRARGPGFDFRVAPLLHWVATLGKLFTHILLLQELVEDVAVATLPPQFLSSKKLGYKSSFRFPPKWLWKLSALF